MSYNFCSNCGCQYDPATLGNKLAAKGCPNCGYSPLISQQYLKSISIALELIANAFTSNEHIDTRETKTSNPTETPPDRGPGESENNLHAPVAGPPCGGLRSESGWASEDVSIRFEGPREQTDSEAP